MFFKAINNMRNNKHGFTLAELLVTCAIMALVAGLLAMIMGPIWKKYRMVENLYIVQTEVRAIMNTFSADASQGSLSTATNVDLLYEDQNNLTNTKQFVSCPELGTFAVNDADNSLYFPSRDTASASFNELGYQYTYIFVYDGHMYVLNGKEHTAYRISFADEIEVKIKYSVSVDAFGKDETGKEGQHRKDDSTITDHIYLNDGVTITVESGPNYDFHYDLNTSFALKNTAGKNYVNLNSPFGDYLTNQYCAGYIYGTKLKTNDEANLTPEDFKYPNTSYEHLSDDANIIRYISLKNFNSGDVTGNNGSTGTNFGCSFTFLMMNSRFGEGVLNTFRGFRDNVLKGTVVGDKIIDIYYTASPEIISFLGTHEGLRNLSAMLVKNTAFLLEIFRT